MTKTIDTEQQQDAYEENVLGGTIRQFIRRWSPRDHEIRCDFEAELHMLIRRIYQDAQAPLVKQMSAALALAPMPPIIIRKEP
jgi:uncharacterized protein (DUF2267 family)